MELGPFEIAVLAAGGVVAGLGLLLRGLPGYGRAARFDDTSTSRIASLAIGEVQVSGVIEPAGLTLVSPLQSAPCVYYRSSISEMGDGEDDTVFEEERAVGFRVRDGTGTVRVFPRDARFEVPPRFDDATGPFGDTPPGLRLRSGSMYRTADQSREAQIAELLTVRAPNAGASDGRLVDDGRAFLGGGGGGRRSRRYREARLEPGDRVTVAGQVLPFDQLPDPANADRSGGELAVTVTVDEETSEAIAAARAAGVLAATPEAAWGNAAIPGFGVGRPVRPPALDSSAVPPTLASADEADWARRAFEIEPHDLVLAAGREASLVIAHGSPEAAAARHRETFLVGLLGAVLAIASAVALALVLGGELAT